MLIRLLQRVSDIRLVQEVNPEAVPPLGFAESKGSDGTDKVFFKNHLTMYVKGGVWLKMNEVAAADV
ncbi:hypothetical protein PHLCEN_2v3571 [Hermanssonia centrifuga]|uniref:Uncharacterized protein n=1 Tax=Hermanssonia centrifuga TaxID=98765 RepID=A0A2R6QEQ9_9APHY|nr:hypothetical protein PHLCEN_2v3571 [Hermanssonia centrifuga]